MQQVTCDDTHACSTRLTLFVDVFERYHASAISFPRVTFLVTFQQVARVSCNACVVENVSVAANCEVSQPPERPHSIKHLQRFKAICPREGRWDSLLLSPAVSLLFYLNLSADFSLLTIQLSFTVRLYQVEIVGPLGKTFGLHAVMKLSFLLHVSKEKDTDV